MRRAPADDGDRAGQRRVVLATLAAQPEPRRRAVQVAERGGRARGFHGRRLEARRAHQVQPLGLVVNPESRNKGFSDIGPNGCRAAAMSHSDP